MKERLNKESLLLLRRLAGQLPMVMHNTKEVHLMTGEELLEMGYVEHEGLKIDPKQNYRYNQPVQIAANHFRRMKRAFNNSGRNGVIDYVLEINKLAEEQKEQV